MSAAQVEKLNEAGRTAARRMVGSLGRLLPVAAIWTVDDLIGGTSRRVEYFYQDASLVLLIAATFYFLRLVTTAFHAAMVTQRMQREAEQRKTALAEATASLRRPADVTVTVVDEDGRPLR